LFRRERANTPEEEGDLTTAPYVPVSPLLQTVRCLCGRECGKRGITDRSDAVFDRQLCAVTVRGIY
jgi:hypothetical protein